MNLETLKAEHPELVEAITAEALAGMPAALETARSEGATAERERITSVRATLIPGHEALVESMAFDGVSTAADAALAIIGAEKQMQKGAAAVLDAEAPPLVDAVDADPLEGQAKTMKRAEFDALSQPDRRAFLNAGGKIIE